MNKRYRIFARALLLLLAVLLSACGAASAQVPAAAGQYETPTASATVEKAKTFTPAPSDTPAKTNPTVTAALMPTTTRETPAPAPSPTLADTPTSAALAVPGRLEVPILMYHRIRDDGVTRYITTVKAFREQMQALKDAGYHSITIEQLGKALSQGDPLPLHPIVLTFDDGFLDVYQNALPVMKEMGFVGVAYVITATLEKEKAYGYMQVPELKALADAGWEIGSHSVTHTDLMKSKIGMGNEIQKSRAVLEEKLGIKIRSFSYPFGAANPSIKDLVKKSGYDTAVGIGTLITHTPKSLFYLSRREVYRGLTLDQFRALLKPGEADQYVGIPAGTPAGIPAGTPTP